MPDNTKEGEGTPQEFIMPNPAPDISSQPSTSNFQQDNSMKYGELIILGYNGCLPYGERGRRRSKFSLVRREQPNGIKRSRHYIVTSTGQSEAVKNKGQHIISYTMNRVQSMIVEYEIDPETDLFQIGRSPESSIDFVVLDTYPAQMRTPDLEKNMTQSTISRFACRILVERGSSNHPTYIYAAGFDSSRNIFLGEKAAKWFHNGTMDGLTTNGVLVMHPFDDDEGNLQPGEWNEVSVDGNIYSLRESRASSKSGALNEDEINILQDFSLIDLCGATLLYRTYDSLQSAPTIHQLEKWIEELNAMRPQCPVGLNTLVIAQPAAKRIRRREREPCVYLSCGHVQGYHEWGVDKHNVNTRTCPICLKDGSVAQLQIGFEPSFYVDHSPTCYAFSPCGHMTTFKTVKYWSSVKIPHGLKDFHAICPFCATILGSPPYIRLIFQDNLD